MRSHLPVFVIGLLAAACATESVQRPPPPPVDWQSLELRSPPDAGMVRATEKERAAAELYIKALASAGFAQLGSMLDEDAHFSSAAKDTRGPDRVIRAHDELFGAFDERTFVLSRVFRTDRSQALEWTMTGLQARAWMGILATGKPVTIQGVTLLWTNDDGSLTDVHVYFDPTMVKAQLGVGPSELPTLSPPAIPSGAPQLYEQAGTPEEATNVALFRALLKALEDNQESAFLSTLASDVEVFTLDRAKPVRGKDALERLFKSMRKAIGDLDTVVHNAWGVQQFAVVEYSIAGLQLAPLGRIAFVPNRLFSIRLVEIAEVREGKIARIWRYDDSGALEPSK